MKVTDIEFTPGAHPPLLRLIIHGAPHRRIGLSTIRVYRTCLFLAGLRAGVFEPIDFPTDVDVTFINPTSPDLGNLYLAFEQAVDGKTLSGKSLFTDDRHIHAVRMSKIFINPVEAPSRTRLQLPRFATAEIEDILT